MNEHKGSLEFEGDFYDEDEDTQKDKFLTFAVGSEEYALEIRCVTEIVGIQNITHVPDMPLNFELQNQNKKSRARRHGLFCLEK